MRQLLRGQIERAGYCALLRNLHPLYQALETGLLLNAGHAGLALLQQPALPRAGALAADLCVLHGPGWAGQIALVPAAQAYAEHLEELALRQPALLAAHAYVRYLGDLSGGQLLVRVVAARLQLVAGEGLAFYDFGSAEQAARLARDLRNGFNLLPQDEAGAQALVDEACAAFARHKILFEQLAA
jgi:heme oxygenase